MREILLGGERVWLGGCSQRVVVSGSVCRWRPSSVSQQSILAPVLFNIFNSDVDDGIERSRGMFADGGELSGAAEWWG